MGGWPGTVEGMRRASMSRRRTRTQNEWKVEITGLAMLNPPTSFSTRSPISAAALLVKVIARMRSEEHTSELQSQSNLVCRLLLEKKKKTTTYVTYSMNSQSAKLDDG